MMSFYWYNMFNGLEQDGPFGTIREAKARCVAVYKQIQDDAFDVAIIEEAMVIVARGHIVKGKWIDGKRKLSKTQREVGERFRAMRAGVR
jgi:hypothetical protein